MINDVQQSLIHQINVFTVALTTYCLIDPPKKSTFFKAVNFSVWLPLYKKGIYNSILCINNVVSVGEM